MYFYLLLGIISLGVSCAAQYITEEPIADVPIAEKGLYPRLINLATAARISVNATCGQNEPEMACKLTEHSSNRPPQCSICDSRSPDPSRRHPITNAIDGNDTYWQSPTLAAGRKFEWVTITLDLRDVYHVAYVIVKSAVSPRPGNWVLERSVDGRSFQPWQYHAISDAECQNFYEVPPTKGRPHFTSDTQVICTSYFSRLNPLEDGEMNEKCVLLSTIWSENIHSIFIQTTVSRLELNFNQPNATKSLHISKPQTVGDAVERMPVGASGASLILIPV